MSSNPADDLLEVTATDDTLIVGLRFDRLDDSTSQSLSGRLLRLVDQSEENEMHLDLGQVGFITSTGLGLFIALHKKLRDQNRHLALFNVDADVYEVFEVTHLHKLLDVRPEAAN